MSLNTFGERVNCLRRLWGLTQPEVKKVGGPGRTTLFRIESGVAGPEEFTDTTLNGLAHALKCEREWLVTGIGRVWVEGVIPPEGAEKVLGPIGTEVPVRVFLRTPPVLGRHITDGPVDWAIVALAVEIVKSAVITGSILGKTVPLNYAEAYRLVYIHLSKQKDPLLDIPRPAIALLLSLASEGRA